MLVPVENLAEFGVIRDVPDYLLPPNAWTDARNVRFRDGHGLRMGGSRAVLDPPQVTPYWLLYATSAAKAAHWIYAGLNSVWTFTSGGHFDITRAAGAYTATQDGLWNGGMFQGLVVLNNGEDVPQLWGPIGSGTQLVNLTNWPGTDRCRVLRPFKNFLFALDMTVSGNRFPHRLKISHPASPGAVPSSWDETDPALDVTMRDIADDESDGLVDAVPLGGIMVVYKQRTTHYAQFRGGQDKWLTDRLFQDSGLLGDHCAVAFDEGRRHFAMTGEDIIVHDGRTRNSVIDKRLRRWLLSNMDVSTYHRSFSVAYPSEGECWFCFPTAGSAWPNLALVWNSKDGSVTFRELDQAAFIASGQIPQETADSWDADLESWDTDVTTWDVLAHQPFVRRLLQAKPTTPKLLHLEAGATFDGVTYSGTLERTGLDLLGIDRQGKIVRNKERRRLLSGMWVYASGAPFDTQVAIQTDVDGVLTWQTAQTFVPGVDEKIDFSYETRLFGVRFIFSGATEIRRYAMDIEPLGAY